MRKQVIDNVDRWVKKRQPIPSGELALQHKDGSSVPVFSSHVMQEGPFGKPELFCIDVDLSQLHKSMHELTKANEQWEQTFNTVPDPVIIIDADYRILKANQAMIDRVARPRDYLVGRKCYTCIHDQAAPVDGCPHEQLLNNGQVCSLEMFESNLSGDFLITTSPLYDSSDKLYGSVCVAHDITARKQAERDRLSLIEEQKDQLVREVHHRIKTTYRVSWGY